MATSAVSQEVCFGVRFKPITFLKHALKTNLSSSHSHKNCLFFLVKGLWLFKLFFILDFLLSIVVNILRVEWHFIEVLNGKLQAHMKKKNDLNSPYQEFSISEESRPDCGPVRVDYFLLHNISTIKVKIETWIVLMNAILIVQHLVHARSGVQNSGNWCWYVTKIKGQHALVSDKIKTIELIQRGINLLFDLFWRL